MGYKGVMRKVYKTWDGIPEVKKNHLEDRTHSLPNLHQFVGEALIPPVLM